MLEMHLQQLGGNNSPSFPLLTGNYKQLATASVPRDSHNTEHIDGKFYSIGGSYNTTLNSVMEVYDLETNVWSTLVSQNPPPVRQGAASCVLDGKLYLFAGSGGPIWSPMLKDAYCFDPETGAWTRLADLPYYVALHSAVAILGKIYLMGGFNGSSPINTLAEYNPATDTWRNIPNPQGFQHGHSAHVINNRMFLVGGVAGSALLNRCVAYDPVTDTWTTYASSPLGNTYHYAGALGRYIYMFGGSYNSNTTHHNRLFRFSLDSNAWIELPAGASARYFGDGVITDKALYLHGGLIGTTLQGELWEIT